MAYEKTSSGVIFEEDTWASCPAGMNEEEDTPGRITYPADGTVVFTTATNAQYAYLVKAVAMADADEWVTRIKAKASTGGGYGTPVCHLHDTAAVPSGSFAWASPPNRSVMRFFGPSGAGLTSIAAWETTAVNVWTLGAFAYDTYYLFETLHGATQDTLRYMLGSDLTAYLKTGAYNHAFTNDPFAVFGDGDTTNFRGTLVIDYIQILESLDVVVTDLGVGSGYTVKLYDSSDNEQASASESGAGTATLDCSQVEFELSGYFEIYDGVDLVRRLPASGNFTGEGVFGGDEWPGVLPGPAISSITPGSEQVGEEVTIAGSAFGASQSTSTVTFNGTDAGTATSWSDTEIVIDVPLSATTGDVVVTVDGDASAGESFTVLPPTVSAITPDTGVNTGSIIITNLAGTGFLTGETAKLKLAGESDISATDVVVVSGTQITCTFDLDGALAGDWDVEVDNPSTATGTLVEGFEVTDPPPPSIVSVAPARGGKGLRAIIAGLDFADTEGTVLLDDTECEILAWNDTNVTIRIPELP